MWSKPHFRDLDSDEREFVEQHKVELDALRAAAATCPDPDMISALCMGVLPEKIADDIRAHIAGCRLCATLEDGFRETVGQQTHQTRLGNMGRRIETSGASKVHSAWRPTRWGIAAALLIAMGIGTVSLWLGRDTALPPASVAVTTPPTGPVFLLPLNKAPLKLPLSALTWRGDESSKPEDYLSQLGRALEPYRRDDFVESALRFEQLIERYPSAVEPGFYMGVCLLFLDRPEDARNSLERARQLGSDALAQDIQWYLAIAFERSADLHKASAVLEELCESEGPYRGPACELYTRLK